MLFRSTGRGSDRADDVDSFLAEVSSSYEQMFKENGELVKNSNDERKVPFKNDEYLASGTSSSL